MIILSNDEICSNASYKDVNAIPCSSVRDDRMPRITEVFLDATDGLDRKSSVRCNFFYSLPKAEFQNLRGTVSINRRKQIVKVIAISFRFPVAL